MKADTGRRLLDFLVAVVACALITGLAALVSGFAVLPPGDLARKQGLLLSLLDPLLLFVFFFITLAAALIAYPIAVWALWRVRLDKAVPLVFLVSVTSAALTAAWYQPLSAPVSLLASSMAMLGCRYYRPWRAAGDGHASTHAG